MKPWYTSQTILGLIATALATVVQASGHAWAPEDTQEIVGALALLGQGGGLLWAAWGRWRATGPLSAGKGTGAVAGCLVLALALGLSGCGGIGGNAPQVTTTEPVIVDGKPVPGEDGKPLTRTTTAPVEADYYARQAENKPVFELKAPAGQAITLPAGTELAVRVPVTVRQYVTELVQAIRELKEMIPYGLAGYQSYQQGETARAGMSAAKGNKTAITTSGDGSPVNAPGGNSAGGQAGASVPTTTTTTTNPEPAQ